jgi:hypothetical protein
MFQMRNCTNEQAVVQSKQQYENDNSGSLATAYECQKTNHLTYTRYIHEKKGQQKYQQEDKVGQNVITTTKLLTTFAILKE